MKNFCKSMDELPLFAKIILAIPALDVIWGIYRIFKSASHNDTLGIILGILCIIPGAAFIWLIDIISLLVQEKVIWFEY